MGCLFGARLSLHADVTLIGHWPAQLRALAISPLQITSADGRHEAVHLNATDDLRMVEPVDVALILTKSSQTQRAAEEASQLLKPDGLAITLQNGLGNLEIIQTRINRCTLGITMQGASIPQPGRLQLGGNGPTTLVVQPAIDEPVQALARLCTQAGLETQVVEDASALIWRKLAVNAAINPLTAILKVPNGALLTSDHAHQLMQTAAEETQTVATAQGIDIDNVGTLAEEVARRTAANRSSMLQDVVRGAITEIEVINGAIVRLGDQLGISTPVNHMLYRLVKALEDTYAN